MAVSVVHGKVFIPAVADQENVLQPGSPVPIGMCQLFEDIVMLSNFHEIESTAASETIPLSDLVGMLPQKESPYTVEADNLARKHAERCGVKSFDHWRQLGVAFSKFPHCLSVSAERQAAAALHAAYVFLLDDICFDVKGRVDVNEYNIDPKWTQEENLEEFWGRLNEIFWHTLVQPPNLTPIEKSVWEMGNEARRNSPPDWFDSYAQATEAYTACCIVRHKFVWTIDIKNFAIQRLHDSGCLWFVRLLEYTTDNFLPLHVRNHPDVERLSYTAALHAALLNDVFSYAKDVDEGQGLNLVMVLMNRGGLTRNQALRRSIQIINYCMQSFLELEANLPVWEPALDPIVRHYTLSLREFMSGFLHSQLSLLRYFAPHHPFAECRDVAPSYLYDPYEFVDSKLVASSKLSCESKTADSSIEMKISSESKIADSSMD